MQSAASHTADVMAAVRQRIRSLNAGPFAATPIAVEIGNPAQFHPRDSDQPLVTVFVYRIELDNAAFLATPDGAQAVRLHALITAFCKSGASASESPGSFELRILTHVLRLFLEQPGFGPVRITNALPIGPAAALVAADLMITAQPRNLDIEDLNHIWTTQGDTPYRTSLAYCFSFGIITPARPADDGPPVLFPVLENPEDAGPGAIGPHPGLPPAGPAPAPEYGALVLNRGTASAPDLATEARFAAGAGDVVLPVVAIAEAAEPLALALDRWDAAGGGWRDASARLAPAAVTALERLALQGGAPMPASPVTLADDGTPALLRLRALRPGQPQAMQINPVLITLEAAP